jgi:hypothetical protein
MKLVMAAANYENKQYNSVENPHQIKGRLKNRKK